MILQQFLPSVISTDLLTHSLTYLLTYAMQQSPSWKPNRFSASQEIPGNLWNLKVHYHNHKNPPHLPILRQTIPSMHPFLFLKIHLIISFHLCLGLPNGLFSSGFPTTTLYATTTSTIRATCLAHIILLDCVTLG